MHIYRVFCLLTLALCLFCSGCTAGVNPAVVPAFGSAEEPAVSPGQEAAATASSLLPEPGALCAEAEEAFRADLALGLDFSSFPYDAEYASIPELMTAMDVFTGMCARYEAALKQTAEATLAAVQNVLPDAFLAGAELDPMDWRLMVALSDDCGETPSDKLIRLTQVQITLGRDNAVYCKATHPGLTPFLEGEEPEVRHSMVSIFAYLNTVYDEAGAERGYDGSYELSGDYIAALADPLPKRTIKNGWFNDRSNATRRHTGTDIRANEGEEIHSCTGGTVWGIGFGTLAGNYVAVLDDSGFLYLYCHMVELTDFLSPGDRVTAGDVIGHVGNTGNSDANHLHLSIITPDYCYINPYYVLKAVRAR